MKNYDASATMSATKNAVRADITTAMLEFFRSYYGEENVSIVGNNEIAVAAGEKTLSDGTIGEICAVVKPVIKEYESRTTVKGEAVEPYERLIEADSYQEEVEQKAAEKAEKAAAKAAKIAKAKADKTKEQNWQESNKQE